MFRTTSLATTLAVFLFAAACASTGEPRSGSSDTSVITEEEVANSHAANAYDLVQSLRPRWLNIRGQSSLGTTTRRGIDGGNVDVMVEQDIPIYLDGTRIGGVETLRNVSTRELARLERLNAGTATQRFGGGHPNGAILLSTR
jgi:hypothetical protein